MREIRFRAWDKEYAKMTIPYSLNELLCGASALHKCFQEDYVWMQYTGLKDKNGREIYEGDVVQTYQNKFTGPRCVIKYDGHGFCMAEETDDRSMDCIWYFIVEVIGNVYENPELAENLPNRD